MTIKDSIKKARQAIESMYDSTCDIIEYRPVIDSINKRTQPNKQEVKVYENKPCRISYSSISNANQSEPINNISQIVKLFIAPELTIKEGSKIVITKGAMVENYKNSGIPAKYDTHQEIILQEYKNKA